MSLLTQSAMNSLKSFASNEETIARQNLTKHTRAFDVRRLGHRGVASMAILLQPEGLEIASGHLLCRQSHCRWFLLQDIAGVTLLGRGVDTINDKGHHVKVTLDKNILARDGEPLSGRLARLVNQMNTDMTCSAVLGGSKRWKTLLGSLPSDLTPLPMEGFQTPTLMSTVMVAESDDNLRDLIVDLAEADIDSFYRAARQGRTYYNMLQGVAHVAQMDAYTVIEVTPVENINTVQRLSFLTDTCQVLVNDGDTVEPGAPLFTLFPDGAVTGTVRFNQEKQTEQLVHAFSGDAGIVSALNQLYFTNEVFRCDKQGHIAVPYSVARRLKETTLKKYGTTRDGLRAGLAYDLNPVANRFNDELHGAVLLPHHAPQTRGLRYVAGLQLDIVAG